jgi:hypothetical protein
VPPVCELDAPVAIPTLTEELPPSDACRRLLSNPDIGPTLIKSVTRRLRDLYENDIEESELVGWAQIGLVRAANVFIPSKFVGLSRDLTRRLCKYMIVKGRNLAIDEMRHAGVVGRKRNGVYCASTIKSVERSTFKDDFVANAIRDVADPHCKSSNPTLDNVIMKDVYALIVPHLEKREAFIFSKAYVEGAPFKGIAVALKISNSRLYVIHELMIQKIHAILGGKNSVFCPN